MQFLLAVSLSMLLQQSGPARTTGPCSVANSGAIDTVNITCGIGKEDAQKMLEILNTITVNQVPPDALMTKLNEIVNELKVANANLGKPSIKVDEIVLDRDLDTKDRQSLAVYRNHFMRIHFSTGIDWTSNKLSVFVAGGNYPFSFVQPRELQARIDQPSPKEAVIDIFRVNNNVLHSGHGEDLIAFGELSFVTAPDTYPSSSSDACSSSRSIASIRVEIFSSASIAKSLSSCSTYSLSLNSGMLPHFRKTTYTGEIEECST
jgi:hypothetical protein